MTENDVAARKPRVRLCDRYGPPLPPEMIDAMALEWYLQNKEAIDEYNADVAKHGLLLDPVWTSK